MANGICASATPSITAFISHAYDLTIFINCFGQICCDLPLLKVAGLSREIWPENKIIFFEYAPMEFLIFGQ
jgi:hypothetical protein